MTANYEADLLAKTAVELRKIGASLEIPGAAKGRKTDLVIAIAAKYAQAEIDRQKAAKATPAKRQSKRCMEIGCQRPASKDSPEGQLCTPCLTKAEWENTHSDYGHDAEASETTDSHDDAQNKRLNGCWVCFPELDESAADYTPRTGTARSGMVLNTKNGQTGEEKAATVAEALKHLNLATHVEKGRVILAGDDGGNFTFELVWDRRGRYQYGPSIFTVAGKTRKVRNVAEMLRLAK
jgi:hypothetical protein